MQLTSIEAWVRFLRRLYSVSPKGEAAITKVEVSTSYPFTDIPENSNLPNNLQHASFAEGTNRNPSRRKINPPEVTVHNAGESFPKRYMDNYVATVYSHDVFLRESLRGKVALVKNVFLEQEDGSLYIMAERDHYIFDPERHVISFHSEYYGLVPVDSIVYYNLELYTEAESGHTELVESGTVYEGEQIGVIYSLESNPTIQIDFWGGDNKQAEWLLQRFKRAWADEKSLRQELARYGLTAFNMQWDHMGMNKSFDLQLRPYLYNITAKVEYTTESRLIQLSPEFLNKFDKFSGGDWRGEIVATYEGRPIRRYVGSIAVDQMTFVFIDPQYSPDDPATYTVPRGSSVPMEKA